MIALEIIEKKKHNIELTAEEIDFFVRAYTYGDIPDYQMSAFLMAVYFNGMTPEETSNLTMSFVHTGDMVDLSEIEGIKVDKHSTGGVGDKISLIVIPLVAATGIPVAKMSGRGLGHTGGTIDKLESIRGFRTELSPEEFIKNVNEHKMAIVGQTANLTPADKKIYALRDVTATIDSIPLIASSIMSKKIASGSDAIVLDVKVGSGAFMKTIEEAEDLARTMVSIGNSLGRKTVAVLTNMDQPLGHEVGNSNEVEEAIRVLKGHGAEDETEVALTIAAHMCVLGGAYGRFDEAYEALKDIIESGKAFDKLVELVEIQGGDAEVVRDTNLLPKAKRSIDVLSEESGYVIGLQAENIGVAAMLLGAGRRVKGDSIDFGAGITLKKKIGDYVEKGEVLCVLHTDHDDIEDAQQRAFDAYTIGAEKPVINPIVYETIE